MAKRVKFTATFPSDGAVFTRTSDRKEYTHAWRVKAKRGPIPASWTRDTSGDPPEGEVCSVDGFASSQVLAERAANTALNVYQSPTRGKYAMAYANHNGSREQRTFTDVVVEVVAVVREG